MKDLRSGGNYNFRLSFSFIAKILIIALLVIMPGETGYYIGKWGYTLISSFNEEFCYELNVYHWLVFLLTILTYKLYKWRK